MMVPGAPGRSSSSVNVRPMIGATPSVGNRSALTEVPVEPARLAGADHRDRRRTWYMPIDSNDVAAAFQSR